MKMKYLWIIFCLGCFQPEQQVISDELYTDSTDLKAQTIADSSNGKTTADHNTAKTIVKEKLSVKDEILSQSVSVSNDFYNCLLKQDYNGANRHLHPDAVSETSLIEWIGVYQKAQEQKGKLGFVKMVAHGAKAGIDGGNGKGDYAELIFDTQYKDGNMREKLIFFRKDSTEKMKLLGYEYHMIVDNISLSDVLK